MEYLRTELRAQRISWFELAELQSLAKHIDPGDVELLEAAVETKLAGLDAEIETLRKQVELEDYREREDVKLSEYLASMDSDRWLNLGLEELRKIAAKFDK